MRQFTPTVLLLLAACLGCAAATAQPAPSSEVDAINALPSLAGLDSLRTVAAASGQEYDVRAPLLERGLDAAVDPPLLRPDEGVAWAIYRFPVDTYDTPLEVQANGGEQLWLLAADYGTGRWTWATEFEGQHPSATLDLTQLGDPVSPAGYVYAAVVAPPGAEQPLSWIFYTRDVPDTEFNYWVAPDGSDANPGTPELPWLTLQHAADTVGPDTTVNVRPGTYAGFHQQRSGDPDAGTWIRYVATGPGVFIAGSNANTPDSINIENWGDGGDGPVSFVQLHGFHISGATRAGIRIVGSETEHAHDVHVYDCECDGQGQTRWGIFSGFADGVRVEGCELHDSSPEHGMYLSNSGDVHFVLRNHCYGNAGSGIQFNADASLGGDGVMSGSEIAYNVCYDNGSIGGAALNMDGVRDSRIHNNLLFGNHATGLVLYSGDGLGSQDNLVAHNTIVQPADGRWCVTINTDSGGNRLFNNVLLTSHPFRGVIDIDSASLAGFESDHNVVQDRFLLDDGETLALAQWQAQTGQDAHSVVSTPAAVFADAATDDYRLRAGSPAIDLGEFVDPLVHMLDVAGLGRDQPYDAGAYEYAP